MPRADGTPKVYGYRRASTIKQENTIDQQKAQIESYLKAKGLPECDTWYTDSATSGGTPMSRRHAGGLMLQRVRKGDIVVFTKMDRAFRNLADMAVTLEAFAKQEVDVHIIEFPVPLNSMFGRLVAGILGSCYQFEKELVGARTRETMRHLRSKGAKLCKDAPLGFKHAKVKAGGKVRSIVVPDPEERAIFAQILHWRTATPKLSFNQITRKLFEMGVKTPDGNDYSRYRVMRACKAECKLRALYERSETSERE